jgi:hypothetical protein
MLYIIVNLIFNHYGTRGVDFRSSSSIEQELRAIILLPRRNNAICGSALPLKVSNCTLKYFFLHGWESLNE